MRIPLCRYLSYKSDYYLLQSYIKRFELWIGQEIVVRTHTIRLREDKQVYIQIDIRLADVSYGGSQFSISQCFSRNLIEALIVVCIHLKVLFLPNNSSTNKLAFYASVE